MPGGRAAAAEAQPPRVEVEVDAAVEALDRINHIVVLMLENRSFDHMLGFLGLEQARGDVDGPSFEMKNEYRGDTYHVHLATSTKLVKAQDPCHSGWCVDEQLDGDSGGFVSNYLKTRRGPRVGNPGIVMALPTAAQLFTSQAPTITAASALAGAMCWLAITTACVVVVPILVTPSPARPVLRGILAVSCAAAGVLVPQAAALAGGRRRRSGTSTAVRAPSRTLPRNLSAPR